MLSTIGIEAGHRDGELAEWGDFSIAGDGPRAQYVEDYYGAFLLDPDGHNVEVVNHRR